MQPPTDPRRATGQQGEAIAAHFLEQHGYHIVTRNWRSNRGELDLVAIDGPTLVIVEVRTRRGAALGSAEESVTRTKQQRLARLAQHYLATADAGQPWHGPWRIDVIAIHLDRHNLATVNHIVSAVEE